MGSSLSRGRWQLATALALAALVGVLGFKPAIDSGGDNGEYLALARSLVDGTGFRMIAEPGEPMETKRWPGYPVFLAGWMLVFGENLTALKTASVLCFAGAVGLSWVLIRRQAPGAAWIAGASALVFIMNEETLHYAGTVYSEMLFVLLSLGALVALERTAELPGRWWRWGLLAALLCTAATYTRPHGLALVPAAFAFLALRRKWRAAIVVPGLIALALLPWAWRQAHITTEGGHTYLKSTLGTTEEDAPGASGLAKYAHRIGRNAAVHFLSMGRTVLARPDHLSFTPEVTPPPPAQDAAPVAADEAGDADATSGGIDKGMMSRYFLAAVVLLGAIVTWRGPGSAIHWHVVFTFALLLVTPWPRARYLFPLLPFFAWFFISAVLWLPTRLRRWLSTGAATRLGKVAVASACGLALLLGSMTVSQQLIANLRDRGLPYWAPQRYTHEGLDIANYMRAAVWIRDNTPHNAVIVARKPYQVYWVSRRKSDVVWNGSIDGAWQGFNERAGYGPVYVIEDAFAERYDPRAQSRTWWGPALRGHPGEATVVYETQPPEVRVWALHSPVAAGGESDRSTQDRAPVRD